MSKITLLPTTDTSPDINIKLTKDIHPSTLQTKQFFPNCLVHEAIRVVLGHSNFSTTTNMDNVKLGDFKKQLVTFAIQNHHPIACNKVFGLVNLGNTCFLNSGVQALFALQPLMDVLFVYNRECSLVRAFCMVYLEKGGRESLRRFVNELFKKVGKFGDGNEHCGFEFISDLLSFMGDEIDEVLKSSMKKGIQSASNNNLAEHVVDTTDYINNNKVADKSTDEDNNNVTGTKYANIEVVVNNSDKLNSRDNINSIYDEDGNKSLHGDASVFSQSVINEGGSFIGENDTNKLSALLSNTFTSILQCLYCQSISTTNDPFSILSLPIPSRSLFHQSIYLVRNNVITRLRFVRKNINVGMLRLVVEDMLKNADMSLCGESGKILNDINNNDCYNEEGEKECGDKERNDKGGKNEECGNKKSNDKEGDKGGDKERDNKKIYSNGSTAREFSSTNFKNDKTETTNAKNFIILSVTGHKRRLLNSMDELSKHDNIFIYAYSSENDYFWITLKLDKSLLFDTFFPFHFLVIKGSKIENELHKVFNKEETKKIILANKKSLDSIERNNDAYKLLGGQNVAEDMTLDGRGMFNNGNINPSSVSTQDNIFDSNDNVKETTATDVIDKDNLNSEKDGTGLIGDNIKIDNATKEEEQKANKHDKVEIPTTIIDLNSQHTFYKKTQKTYTLVIDSKFKNYKLTKEKNKLDINDCIEFFMQKEYLTKENAFFCDNCKRVSDHSKQIRISKLNKVLIVHFKRKGLTKKNRDFIDFPEVLSVNLNAKPEKYALKAFVSHFELSFCSGHYTAYVYKNNKIYLCNDSSVGEVNEARKDDCCMLFYARE